jgi:diguanylate cyclase (GGDEF)-like protein
VTLVASVDLAAALLSVAIGLRATVTTSDLLRFGTLAVLSVIYLEISRRVEHRRRLFAEGSSYIDVSSVWVFAGAIVLPTVLAVVIAIVIYTHLWLRSWRHVDSRRMYRSVYTGATIVLSCLAASSMISHLDPAVSQVASSLTSVLALLTGLLAFRVVNAALIASAFVVSTGSTKASVLLGTRSDNVFEFSTLLLGAVTAVALDRVPWFAVMVLPAVFLLQYHALLRDLVQAATVDAKTELLNAAAWRQLAQRELTRAGRQHISTAVLVIDMDRFKQINDTYGHLAGDTALKSVAEALADELREYDAVGRFGGEEFVALLPAADDAMAGQVAERLRRRIELTEIAVAGRDGPRRLHVTASVGVASGPGGAELDDLLHAADKALYVAKREGRNAVRVAAARIAA